MKQNKDKWIDDLKKQISGYEVPGAGAGWDALSRKLDAGAAGKAAGGASAATGAGRGWKVRTGIAAAAAAAVAAVVLLLPEKSEDSAVAVSGPAAEVVDNAAAEVPASEALSDAPVLDAASAAAFAANAAVDAVPAASGTAATATPVTDAVSDLQPAAAGSAPSAAAGSEKAADAPAGQSSPITVEKADAAGTAARTVKTVTDKSFEDLLAEAYPDEGAPEDRRHGWNITAGTSAVGAGAGEALVATRALSRIEGIFIPPLFYSFDLKSSPVYSGGMISSGVSSELSGNPSGSATCNSVDMAQVKSGNVASEFSDKAVSYTHRQPVRISLFISREFGAASALESGLVYSIHRTEYAFAASGAASNVRTLHYLGIPLNYRWNMVARPRFDAYLKAGAMAEKCLGGTNDIYLKPDTKTVCLSLNGAAGAEYLVSDHLGIFAEPGVSYYLPNDSYTISIYNDNPLSFSLNAGVRFRL